MSFSFLDNHTPVPKRPDADSIIDEAEFESTMEEIAAELGW